MHIKNKSDAAKIHPGTISITILGPDAAEVGTDDTLRKRISVYVDAAKAPEGISVKPARIRLPDGYVLIKADPELFLLDLN
ncbi:MAG: hypothetical protein R6X08_04725 [Desulfosalsimonadaceae bacterium]